MPGQGQEVVVGLDNGGTAINATVLDASGLFLVDELVELPSRVAEGPVVAIEALAESFAAVLSLTGTSPHAVRAVGLDTPGPAQAQPGGLAACSSKKAQISSVFAPNCAPTTRTSSPTTSATG